MESVEVDDNSRKTFTSEIASSTIMDCEPTLPVEENSQFNSDEISPCISNKIEHDSGTSESMPVHSDTLPSSSSNKKTDEEFVTLQPKIYVPPTEEDFDLENHKNYLDRYFTQRYCIDVNKKFNDHCVLIHSNKVCVVTLAPSHPLICSDIKVEKINFQVSQSVNRLNNKVSGKRKRNAQNLNQTSPLCHVECANGEVFTIYSVVPGKLLEMNEDLETNPEKIRECSPEFYHKQCYVAMVLPNIRHTVETLNKNFLTLEEYRKAIKEREECNKVE